MTTNKLVATCRFCGVAIIHSHENIWKDSSSTKPEYCAVAKANAAPIKHLPLVVPIEESAEMNPEITPRQMTALRTAPKPIIGVNYGNRRDDRPFGIALQNLLGPTLVPVLKEEDDQVAPHPPLPPPVEIPDVSVGKLLNSLIYREPEPAIPVVGDPVSPPKPMPEVLSPVQEAIAQANATLSSTK